MCPPRPAAWSCPSREGTARARWVSASHLVPLYMKVIKRLVKARSVSVIASHLASLTKGAVSRNAMKHIIVMEVFSSLASFWTFPFLKNVAHMEATKGLMKTKRVRVIARLVTILVKAAAMKVGAAGRSSRRRRSPAQLAWTRMRRGR